MMGREVDYRIIAASPPARALRVGRLQAWSSNFEFGLVDGLLVGLGAGDHARSSSCWMAMSMVRMPNCAPDCITFSS
jgi:hypothetical protein